MIYHFKHYIMHCNHKYLSAVGLDNRPLWPSLCFSLFFIYFFIQKVETFQGSTQTSALHRRSSRMLALLVTNDLDQNSLKFKSIKARTHTPTFAESALESADSSSESADSSSESADSSSESADSSSESADSSSDTPIGMTVYRVG